MSESPSKRDLYPNIVDYYNGKSVLITGAAGFVGMLILEVLLRTCPGIESIYILIREKKGVKPEARKEKLFQKPIFDHLKANKPEFLEKVHVVAGDVVLPNLGMSEEDLKKIIENVSIVYHCAADISFLKPLKHLIENNAYGTYNVVQLCKKLRQIDVLVYTSTICSNCNRNVEIEEEVYRLPFPSEKFLNELKNGTDESLEALVSQCLPPWPNSYTFSKCLSENILLENVAEVPFAVIRPSLVAHVWKAPNPGFAERNSSLVLLCVGSGKGFIKVLLLDPENIVDMVPVDVVANAHIAASWRVATERSPSHLIVNCCSYGTLNITWADVGRELIEMHKNQPFPNTFRKTTGVKLIKSRLEYRILCFYEHYVPAYVLDFLLKVSGKKPRLVPLYNLFDKAMFTGEFFTTGRWTFAIENFLGLQDGLNEDEKEIFYTDFSSLDFRAYVNDLPTGNSEFDWAKDKLTVKERQKKSEQRYILSTFIKYCFLIIMVTMLYFVISKTTQLIGIF